MNEDEMIAAQLLWGADVVSQTEEEIKIRLAVSADLESVVTLRMAALREFYEIPESEKIPEEFVESAAEFFVAGDQITAIAEDKGSVVACATLCYYSLLPNLNRPNGRCAHLTNVYTSPEYRNQKIASRLIELLIEEARNRGVSEISCSEKNNAGALYERLGFTEARGAMFLSLCSDF